MNIQQILNSKSFNAIFSVSPDKTVFEALEIMAEKNIGALLITENGKLAGIFSERDYARKIVLKGKISKDTLLSEVMTSKVITVSPEDKLELAMGIMSEKHIRHLPVVKDEELVGIISINDVVTAIILEQKNHIDNLHTYIRGGYG